MLKPDAAFWTGLFTTLAALIAAARYLIGRVFNYWAGMQKRRTDDAIKIENIKTEYSLKILGELQSTVSLLKPLMAELQKRVAALEELQKTAGEFNKKLAESLLENQMKMMELVKASMDTVIEVKKYFEETKERHDRVKEGGRIILDKVNVIEKRVEAFGKVIHILEKRK